MLTTVLAALCLQADAAVPPPEKLLPKDTLMVVSAPDWGKAMQFWTNAPYNRLWQDASLRPFKDKFVDKFTAGVVVPVEQSLGIKFSDYQGLAQGQLTFALVPVASDKNANRPLAGILLMDARDHSAHSTPNLRKSSRNGPTPASR